MPEHLTAEVEPRSSQSNAESPTQKLNLITNWIIRGLLLAATIRPKSPASPVIRPVVELIDAAGTELKLLIGLAKFTRFRQLKTSTRASNVFDSRMRNLFTSEKSMLLWARPRKTLRPTLPKSVPVAAAVAVP